MVFTPTWIAADGNMAIRPECRASVEKQEFEGEIVWEIGVYNPYPGQSHRNVLAQYQRGRETFLKSDCDALLLFEHDMTMPANAAQRLWAEVERGAGAAYGVYMLRHGTWVLNTWEYVNDYALGESLSLYPERLAAAREAGVVRICGCGFGCTLVRREVVERFPFRDGGGNQFSPDIPFAWDLLYAGVVSVGVMDVACDHFDGELRLRPFGGAMANMVEVVAMQDVVVLDGRETKKLAKGRTYTVGRVLAQDLLRAGYVVVREDEDGAESGREAGNPAQGEREGDEIGKEPETTSIEAPERSVMSKGRRRKGGL
jgi:hypothetical protein